MKYLILYIILEKIAKHDDKNIIKMYDDVGIDIVNRITDLVELFYGYVMVLRDMSLVKVRS